MSVEWPIAIDSVPASILPGQRARNGTRMPPSCRSVLPPFRSPLFASYAPPLSEVNRTSVFSAIPRSSSVLRIRPTWKSIRATIERNRCWSSEIPSAAVCDHCGSGAGS